MRFAHKTDTPQYDHDRMVALFTCTSCKETVERPIEVTRDHMLRATMPSDWCWTNSALSDEPPLCVHVPFTERLRRMIRKVIHG